MGMKIKIIKILVVGLLAIVTFTASGAYIPSDEPGQKMVSEFGKYQGYSQKLYDGYKRSSDLLTLSDGTQLAYDLYQPTKKGVPASQPPRFVQAHTLRPHMDHFR
jgi:hypothetical protein